VRELAGVRQTSGRAHSGWWLRAVYAAIFSHKLPGIYTAAYPAELAVGRFAAVLLMVNE
jgi:hypothetical protein